MLIDPVPSAPGLPGTDPRLALIVVAAGSGSRLGDRGPKALVRVAGRSILEHALRSAQPLPEAAVVVIVAPAGREADCRAIALEAGLPEGAVRIVPGGVERQDSVAAGLAVLPPAIDVVLVHDAARMLTPASQFAAVVAAVRERGAAVIPALPVVDTLRSRGVGDALGATVDRDALLAVQTPQGFPRAQLDEAYAQATAARTDDAALVAALGHPVTQVPGAERAFKVTTPEDLSRAEALLTVTESQEGSRMRIGTGIDSHAFEEGRELWLGGLPWPGETGLAGHSDGDPVSHAIVDALLSAAGAGDIGTLFGTDDPLAEGAHGEWFLRGALARIREAGFTVGNVSVQLIGNRPRIGPRKAEVEAFLSGVLEAPVTVSGTTTDGLGFTGRGEGVAAIATALLLPIPRSVLEQ